MTEKRFILVEYVNKGLFIQDNANDETQYFQGSKASLEKVVDLLNDLIEEKEQLKTQLQNTSTQRDEFHCGVRENANRVGKLKKENMQLKSELKIYRKVASCSNCKYQNYDWYDDGDEFEICEKGNNNQQMEYHICKEWVEF